MRFFRRRRRRSNPLATLGALLFMVLWGAGYCGRSWLPNSNVRPPPEMVDGVPLLRTSEPPPPSTPTAGLTVVLAMIVVASLGGAGTVGYLLLTAKPEDEEEQEPGS